MSDLTILPCDNLPDNGAVVRRVVTDMLEAARLDLGSYLDLHVEFASCVVDRITPATVEKDKDDVLSQCAWVDDAPVRTEPFSEWVIEGRFPAGRPDWESAGATLTDDVAPFEQRKLRLLNGAHSLLAYAGMLRGHSTVSEAIGDEQCRQWVQLLWAEAGRQLSFRSEEIHSYTDALLERFGNPRIHHQLSQIAIDGSTKVRIRIVPVALAELANGGQAIGCAHALGSWIRLLLSWPDPVQDANAAALTGLLGPDARETVHGVLRWLDPNLEEDEQFAELVLQIVQNEYRPDVHDPNRE